MAKNVRFWVGMVLFGIVMLFTLQNIAIVEVSFFFWSLQLPRAILLFVIFALGAVTGWIFGRMHQKR